MSEIIERKLYLGSVFHTNDSEFLEQKQIQTIICAAEGLQLNVDESRIKVIRYKLQDDYSCKIEETFDEIGQILFENHKNQIPTLIHCHAGVSRSATIVIAFLMKYFRMDLESAFLYVKERRPRICPNAHFMHCLLEYEKQLFGDNSMTVEQCKHLFYYS